MSENASIWGCLTSSLGLVLGVAAMQELPYLIPQNRPSQMVMRADFSLLGQHSLPHLGPLLAASSARALWGIPGCEKTTVYTDL